MLKHKSASLIASIAVCVTLMSCGSKGGGDTPAPPAVPVIKVEDASVARATSGSTLHFTVSLNKITTVPVTVDYTFADGTATSPRDYSSASGTATILANQTQTSIDVPIKADPTDLRQDNLTFTVGLANAKNGALSTASATGTIITADGTNLPTDNAGYSTPTTYPGYTLAWSDEFTAASLDLSAWNQEIGNGSNGWGNHELEYYTSSTKNVFQSNGNLIIEARKEQIGGQNYSSARLTTANKKNFQYGRIDMRAKLPVAQGIWPALWMLGSNINTVPWPTCGEIDMMELIGTFPSRVYGTAHYGVSGTHGSKGSEFNLAGANFSQQFHVFSIIWTPDMIKWLVDDNLYFTTTKTDIGAANYPFNAPEFLIFNLAVGGDWPGAPPSSTPFPQRMFVDYVRVFQ